MQALCSIVVWYSPTIFCEGIIGYDVRFYHPQLVTQNITRRVGANGTFYIIQDKDSLINKQEHYVQVHLLLILSRVDKRVSNSSIPACKGSF